MRESGENINAISGELINRPDGINLTYSPAARKLSEKLFQVPTI